MIRQTDGYAARLSPELKAVNVSGLYVYFICSQLGVEITKLFFRDAIAPFQIFSDFTRQCQDISKRY